MRLKKRQLEELNVVETDNVDVADVFDILLKDRKEVIYIVEQCKLKGIITNESLEAFIGGTGTLIENQVKCVYESEKSLIGKVISENIDINTVAVIDDEKRLLYDYRILNELAEYLSDIKVRKYFKCFLKLLVRSGIDTIVFIENPRGAAVLKAVFEELKTERIVILSELDYIECQKNILFVDDDTVRMCKMKMINREYQIIKDYQLEYLFTTPKSFIKNIEKVCSLIGRTYKNIAIYNTNKLTELYAEELERQNVEYEIITPEDVQYNPNGQEYIINKKMIFDVVLTGSFDVALNKLRQGDKYIYNFVTLFVGEQFLDPNIIPSFQDYDIVNNVLPKLEKLGVKVLVFETVNHDFERKRLELLTAREFQDKEFVRIFGNNKMWTDCVYSYEKGYFDYEDYKSENFNLSNYERKTCYNTECAMNDIYFVGECNIYGILVSDEDTVPSYFQKLVKGYNVHNYGIFAWSMPWKMRLPDYKSGDVLIIEAEYSEVYKKAGYDVVDCMGAYDKFSDNLQDVIWDNYGHCNCEVNKCMAELLYDVCKKKNIISE